MTCQELDERLDDWLDGALAVEAASEVEAHLRSCPLCKERERRLRQVLAHAAALPRSVTPPHDLWPEIARRVSRERSWSWSGWSPVALAAAATVVVGLVAVLWNGSAPSAVRTVQIPAASPETRLLAGVAPPVSDPVLAEAEREYDAATKALLEALLQRRAQLEPEAFAAVQANLEVIDRALAEVRQALAKDPKNPELSRMLVATHQKKVDVLSRVVKLATPL
jgi:anti-sigma factor RsiW